MRGDALAPLSASFTLTPTGLSIDGQPTAEEWLAVGAQLVELGNASAWAIGDWLAYGEGREDLGAMYRHAVDLTKRSYGSLAQCARVSKAFAVEARFNALSWSHHQAVAGVAPDEREALLQRAVDDAWTRDELRDYRREQRTAAQTRPRHLCPKCGWRW